MVASMPPNDIWAYVEMVPNNNIARWARSSLVNMLCIIEKYRLCEFRLNGPAGQKGEFCDLSFSYIHETWTIWVICIVNQNRSKFSFCIMSQASTA